MEIKHSLDTLEIYHIAMEIGDSVWNEVMKWDYFTKKTVGTQFVKAADSIAANISEGYGRYTFKDSNRFFHISRGSILETKTWLTKATNRKLLGKPFAQQLATKLDILHQKLNGYVRFLKNSDERNQG